MSLCSYCLKVLDELVERHGAAVRALLTFGLAHFYLAPALLLRLLAELVCPTPTTPTLSVVLLSPLLVLGPLPYFANFVSQPHVKVSDRSISAELGAVRFRRLFPHMLNEYTCLNDDSLAAHLRLARNFMMSAERFDADEAAQPPTPPCHPA